MIHKQWASFRFLVFSLVAIGLLTVMAVPGRPEDKAVTREQQIADIEKQIGELSRKLATMKQGAMLYVFTL